MVVNSLPKTVTRQRRGCDLNPGPTAPESSTLTTRLLMQLITMHRPIDRYRRSKHRKSTTSLNMARYLLYSYFCGLRTRIVCVKENYG